MLDRDRLRMARLQLRLSQESLGKAIGQDQSYVSKLERGEVLEITISTLERLADVLSVSTDYLLGRATAPETPAPAPVRAAAHPRPRRRTAASVG
jgi:transcriptional regulator with XRE-family HTH domain